MLISRVLEYHKLRAHRRNDMPYYVGPLQLFTTKISADILFFVTMRHRQL